MKLKYIFSGIMFLGMMGIIAMSFKDRIHGQVVCFGDSITYGAKVNGHSWVWYLTKEHADIDFINAGRSGRKTMDREELLPVLKKYSNADYYLIFLGVNDLKDGTDSMVNSCIVNMKWMIAQIRAVDPKTNIVILSPCKLNLKTMDEVNIQKKYNQNTQQSLSKLDKKYKDLARAEHIGFISILNTVSKPNFADGLHPDTSGQKQIAARVWKGMNRLY